MASKKKSGARENVMLINPETKSVYYVSRNKKNQEAKKGGEKLKLKKYDPVLRKHAEFVEKKIPK